MTYSIWRKTITGDRNLSVSDLIATTVEVSGSGTIGNFSISNSNISTTNAGDIILGSTGNTGSVRITGDTGAGPQLQVYGTSHTTFPNRIYIDATVINIRDTAGTTFYGVIDTENGWRIHDTLQAYNSNADLKIRGNGSGSVDITANDLKIAGTTCINSSRSGTFTTLTGSTSVTGGSVSLSSTTVTTTGSNSLTVAASGTQNFLALYGGTASSNIISYGSTHATLPNIIVHKSASHRFTGMTDQDLSIVDGSGLSINTGGLLINSTSVITSARIIQNATRADVDNLRLDGNTLSSTDTDGNVVITPNGNGKISLDSGVLYKSNGQSGTYAPVGADHVIIADTHTATVTVNLPSAPTVGTVYRITDAGNAATNNITINRGGTDLIAGGTSLTVNTNFDVVRLIYAGTYGGSARWLHV